MATNSTFIKVSSGVKLVGKINFQVIWRKRGFLITVALCKDDAKEMIYIYKTQMAFPLQFFHHLRL